jgi:hypothetical protein
MPISALKTRVALAAWVAALSLLAPAMATATEGVDLRVLNTAGHTLTELRQYTGTVHIDTDPGADCFGAGTGGSGKSVRVAGPTALGLVNDASETDADLRPLSVTDAFSFGLGVCGIGGFEASGGSFWYLKVDHFGSQTGGDQTPVGHGDTILWYLSPGFPPARELFLRAPARAEVGVPYQVTVLSYGDGGNAAPAAGATVTDAALPTDADGHEGEHHPLQPPGGLRGRPAPRVPRPSGQADRRQRSRGLDTGHPGARRHRGSPRPRHRSRSRRGGRFDRLRRRLRQGGGRCARRG